jgi:DNA (cytosine-5)-methyltransferase 1
VFKVVQRLRPAWCLFENVAGHVTLGLDAVLADLEGEGYACRPLVVPACGVEADHERKRLWIVAHSEQVGPERSFHGELFSEEERKIAGHPPVCLARTGRFSERYDLPSSRVCRGNDGISRKMDRIGALGNAVVPQVVMQFGLAIMAAEGGKK